VHSTASRCLLSVGPERQQRVGPSNDGFGLCRRELRVNSTPIRCAHTSAGKSNLDADQTSNEPVRSTRTRTCTRVSLAVETGDPDPGETSKQTSPPTFALLRSVESGA
jgi:hypothetical protein